MLAREARRHALAKEQSRATREKDQGRPADDAPRRPGSTINMSREGIRTLPDELVDVLTRHVER